MWTMKWVLSQRKAEGAGLRQESAVEKWSGEKGRKGGRTQGARQRRKCEADEGAGSEGTPADERIPVSLRPSPG